MISVAAYLAVAASFWGGPPSCGTPSVTRAALPSDIAGQSYLDGSCRIEMNERAWADGDAQDRCTWILHEVGHLKGYEHTEDGIMAAVWDGFDDPHCSLPRLRAAAGRK